MHTLILIFVVFKVEIRNNSISDCMFVVSLLHVLGWDSLEPCASQGRILQGRGRETRPVKRER